MLIILFFLLNVICILKKAFQNKHQFQQGIAVNSTYACSWRFNAQLKLYNRQKLYSAAHRKKG